MTTIAQRRCTGLFAATEIQVFGLRCAEFQRIDATTLVRAVAEWLLAATAAGTPEIFSSLHLHHFRLFVCDNWFFHDERNFISDKYFYFQFMYGFLLSIELK